MGGLYIQFTALCNILMCFPGSNWIPADNFLTTLTPERYRAWLTLMRDGNQNMIRLWGGGVYEPDCFYDICDGLLYFSCCLYSCSSICQNWEYSSGKTFNSHAVCTQHTRRSSRLFAKRPQTT